ncbi:MAG: C-GCAxxG-C-C family protein [Candidatus Limivicinus sp.]|jgi:C_GCAxxG_C_C family probable redox protein
MGVKTESARLHDCGFNCAQSVLCSNREYTGIDDSKALALAGGFGGGVRCGEICGALSGAVMAVGCANPYNDAEDTEAKEKIAELAVRCTSEFKEKFNNVRCQDLKNAGHSCDELITYAAEMAEKIIQENK